MTNFIAFFSLSIEQNPLISHKVGGDFTCLTANRANEHRRFFIVSLGENITSISNGRKNLLCACSWFSGILSLKTCPKWPEIDFQFVSKYPEV